MSCNVTALENIREDFGWVTEVAVLLGHFFDKLLTNSIFIFLAGVIVTLLIWRGQTSYSFKQELNAEKRKLYREFLEHVETMSIYKRHSAWATDPAGVRLFTLLGEIELLAGKEVIDDSIEVVAACGDRLSSDEGTVIGTDGEPRTHFDHILFRRKFLIQSMRRELTK